MGEFGICDRRFFLKHNSDGVRTHHIHIYKTDSLQIPRHLAFRDYMISHPELAREYSNLRPELAAKYPQNIDKYINGKDKFIKLIDRKVALLKP